MSEWKITKWIRGQVDAGNTAAWLLILFGALLAPNLLGIGLVVVGIVLLNRKREVKHDVEDQ